MHLVPETMQAPLPRHQGDLVPMEEEEAVGVVVVGGVEVVGMGTVSLTKKETQFQ